MDSRPAALVASVAIVLVAGAVVLQSGAWVGLVGTGEYDEGTVTVAEGMTTPSATATGNGTVATETPTDETSETATDVATTVTVQGTPGGGETLATVEVRIADTRTKRYVGLSETAALETGEGMLFVHDEEETHAYVMRNMSFPLDIVFIDANGTITTIHHAPVPPEGTSGSELERYRGEGLYVLEVNRGWANRTGVSVGDQVHLPDAAT